MTELRPCPVCKRHVAVREITCPFCAIALPPGRGQAVMPRGRITRAAIFSAAALVACDSKSPEPPKPTPAKTGSAAGSDDLERLLDGDRGVVQRGVPADAAQADASVQIAATIDAGVPDAGVDQQALAERKRLREQRKQRELERQRKEQEQLQLQMNNDMHQHAKPYGAPPARKRLV